ncbi:response regulator transcription factor [Anaerotalea alkaliphila]|uniref:Stage 0 sporulation protein A homolog n=1 Tax=Anaerotalea alkaliphila TaxID=2662126 RepID=A0A7X5KMC9_9FIRM|nr:response regulator [Anaerotalea alkaliphila]NDL66573.1 response regulator [Anaerotalea alkaliphila]
MYKVLIVEDEVLVRVGLKTTIDWELHGFAVAAEASNGEQGYEQYQKCRPDVVITDIQMPKRDGLWLVEEIRKTDQTVQILVLTCHDEFEYARRALKVGADDYVLKSEVEDEELLAIMKRFKNNLDQLNRKEPATGKAPLNQEDIKKTLLSSMALNNFRLDGEQQRLCRLVDFPLEDARFAFFQINMNRSTTGEMPAEDSGGSQMQQAMLHLVYDHLMEKGVHYLYQHQGSAHVFLVAERTLNKTEMLRMFSAFNNGAKQYFDKGLNIVYSDIIENLSDLGVLYKGFGEKAQILFYKKAGEGFLASMNMIRFQEPNMPKLKKEYGNRYLEALGHENLAEAWGVLQEVQRYFWEHQANPATVKLFYSNLFGDVLGSYGPELEKSGGVETLPDYHGRVMHAGHWEELYGYAESFTRKMVDEITRMHQERSRGAIDQAVAYIRSHYKENISLEDVAQEVNLSKHYLCSAFKKETGDNMSLYINKLRIEKAKQLLLESNRSIKEIFEEVGYSNQQYFSKVFKKITNMTVVEYRGHK